MISPATISPAPHTSSDRSQDYANDLLTVPASLAGLPAIAVPQGTGPELEEGVWPEDIEGTVMDVCARRRVGVQIIGQVGEDRIVLEVAKLLEEVDDKTL
jgi:aspartyl-tRNA(Asn)/glutamyl-tRNA(Gln) amidotransferase subunit A